MALRTFCLCFKATGDETREGPVLKHSNCGGEALATRRGIFLATGQQPTLSSIEPTSSYGLDNSNSSSVLPSKKEDRKLRSPSSASGCHGPSVAADPHSQRIISYLQRTSGLHSPNQKLSVELTTLADGCNSRIPGVTFPVSASVPVSFEKRDPALRTLKIESANGVAGDTGVTVRALSQLGGGEPCGDPRGSGSPPSTTFPKNQADVNLPARSLSGP
ncbi:hypothetical protein Vretimale_17747, partial [Volvox reticuliferus]